MEERYGKLKHAEIKLKWKYIYKKNYIAGWERIKKYKNYFGLSDDVYAVIVWSHFSFVK